VYRGGPDGKKITGVVERIEVNQTKQNCIASLA